jgi:hypothetical protein
MFNLGTGNFLAGEALGLSLPMSRLIASTGFNGYGYHESDSLEDAIGGEIGCGEVWKDRVDSWIEACDVEFITKNDLKILRQMKRWTFCPIEMEKLVRADWAELAEQNQE